jgi:hypothetical protein
MPPALITPILISAAIGAVTAAVTGGNILKGALFGAVGGAIGGAFLGSASGAATQPAGSALGLATEPVSSLAASGAEAAASGAAGASEGAFSGFVGESAWAPTGGEALDFGSSAGNVAAPTVSQVSGTGLSQPSVSGALSDPVASMGISEPVQSTLATTGDSALFNGAKDSQLASTQLGMEPATTMGAIKQPSTIESMWERVFGKDGVMEKPMFKGLAGSALQGYASGANQQKLLDERKAEIDRNRANARFGTQTSRFAPVGLVATAKTPYKG